MPEKHRVMWVYWTRDGKDCMDCTEWVSVSDAHQTALSQILGTYYTPMLITWAHNSDDSLWSMGPDVVKHLSKLIEDIKNNKEGKYGKKFVYTRPDYLAKNSFGWVIVK